MESSQTRKDLILFSSYFFVVVVVWILMARLSVDHLIGRGDASSGFVWLLNEYKLKSISELSYNPSVLGGYPMAGALGIMWPVYYCMKILGIAPYLMQNLLVFFFQTLIGYFSYKYVRHFQKPKINESIEAFFILCLSAFAPLIAWRVAYGHLNLLFGIFTVVGISYFLQSMTEKTYSLIDLALAFIGFSIAINFPAFQIFAHIIYLLPFYFLLVGFPKPNYKTLFLVLIFFLVNALFMYDLYSYYLLGDSSRGSSINIYSYAPYTWESLAATLAWQNDYLTLSHVPFQFHELHYPIGLGFLSLGLLKRPTQKLTAVILGILVLGFVLDLPGLNLFQELPLLKHMRVPQRIIIPISFMMTLGACIWILNLLPKRKYSRNELAVMTMTAVAILIILPYINFYIEPLIVITTLGLIYCGMRNISRWIPGLLLVMALVGIKSFYMKIMPLLNFYELTTEIQKLSSGIDKKNPYERFYVDFNDQEFFANTALAFEIPSINGNFYATGRFSKFIHALNKVNYNPVALNWMFAANGPNAKIISHLFNIRKKVTLSSSGLEVSDLEMGHQGIIFPEKIVVEDSLHRIVSELRTNWKVGFVENRYAEIIKSLHGCKEGSLQTRYEKNLKIQGLVDEDCVIIIPTNYLSSLKQNDSYPIFPADYTLTGMVVKKGKVDIELKGRFFIF